MDTNVFGDRNVSEASDGIKAEVKFVAKQSVMTALNCLKNVKDNCKSDEARSELYDCQQELVQKTAHGLLYINGLIAVKFSAAKLETDKKFLENKANELNTKCEKVDEMENELQQARYRISALNAIINKTNEERESGQPGIEQKVVESYDKDLFQDRLNPSGQNNKLKMLARNCQLVEIQKKNIKNLKTGIEDNKVVRENKQKEMKSLNDEIVLLEEMANIYESTAVIRSTSKKEN